MTEEGSGSSVSGRTTYQKNDGSTVVTLASSSLEKDILTRLGTYEEDFTSIVSTMKDQIGESFENVKTASQKLITILKSSWNNLQDRKSLQTLKTWIVASKDALENYIESVLTRTKTALTV